MADKTLISHGFYPIPIYSAGKYYSFCRSFPTTYVSDTQLHPVLSAGYVFENETATELNDRMQDSLYVIGTPEIFALIEALNRLTHVHKYSAVALFCANREKLFNQTTLPARRLIHKLKGSIVAYYHE
jgi:hypothetical protein